MRYLLSVCVLFCATSLYAAPLTLNEVCEAACMIYNGYAAGSGTCISKDDTSHYILTNAHVVSNSQEVSVYLFKHGYRSKPIKGKVIWKAFDRNSDKDLAVVKVPTVSFGLYPPRVIPIVNKDYKFTKDGYMYSAGVPEAKWLMGWEGRVVQDKVSRILFTPGPSQGQSGSGIFVLVKNKEGELETRLAAVLTWVFEGGNFKTRTHGGAIPVSTFHSLLNNEKQVSYKLPRGYKTIAIATNNYALGSDGKSHRLYLDNNNDLYVQTPEGVKNFKIVGWSTQKPNGEQPPRRPPMVMPKRQPNCPSGNCPNQMPEQIEQPKEVPLPDNIYGNDPDGGIPDDKEIETLNNTVKLYQEQIEKLTKEAVETVKENADLKEIAAKSAEDISALQAKTELLVKQHDEQVLTDNKTITELQNSLKEKESLLTTAQKEKEVVTQALNSVDTVIKTTVDEKEDLQAKVDEHKEEVAQITASLDSESTQKEVAFGVAILTGLGIGLRSLLKWRLSNRALKAIGDVVGPVTTTKEEVKALQDSIKPDAPSIVVMNEAATEPIAVPVEPVAPVVEPAPVEVAYTPTLEELAKELKELKALLSK